MRRLLSMMLLFAPAVSRADKVEAKRLRDLAIVAVEERHDYSAAIQYMRDALKAFESANMHYNLAILLRDVGQYTEAVSEFRMFLASPSGGDPNIRAKAISEVESLSTRIMPAPASVPAPATTPVPFSKKNYGLPAAFTVGAVSALAIGAGLYGSAVSDYGTLQNDCKLRLCGPNDWQTSEMRGNAGIAMLTIGGVAFVVDAALWWYATKRKVRS